MATSAIPAVIAWCVDTFRAAATLGTADPAVLVLDGPQVAGEAAKLLLWVGVDDPDEEVPSAAAAPQSWAGLGAQRKDEELEIFLCARAWSGDTDIRAVRTAAFTVVAAVEAIVRANASLGGTVLVTLPGVTDLRLRTANTPRGAIADVGFTIRAKARI